MAELKDLEHLVEHFGVLAGQAHVTSQVGGSAKREDHSASFASGRVPMMTTILFIRSATDGVLDDVAVRLLLEHGNGGPRELLVGPF